MTDQAEKKHSAFWGVMVIAGTVIGGGMFALPVDLAGAWFFWGAFILIIAWFSMLHSGLLLLEANLNYPVGSSFNTITKDLIGNTWNIISGITVAFVLMPARTGHQLPQSVHPGRAITHLYALWRWSGLYRPHLRDRSRLAGGGHRKPDAVANGYRSAVI